MMDGICSADQVIKELQSKISEAETEIARVISRLSHCEVSGMFVTYNRSTSRDNSAVFTDGNSTGVYVRLEYRIV